MNNVRQAISTLVVAATLATSSSAWAQNDLAALTPPKSQCPSPCSRGAVVFVHGIAGSEETWKPNQGQSFPKLLESDPALRSRFDVYELDYMTHTETAPVTPTAAAIAESVAVQLSPIMRDYPEVSFVCHSLGGNIVRHYLGVLSAENNAALDKVASLVLLGTPVEGAAHTRLLNLLGKMQLLNPGQAGSYRANQALEVIKTNDYLQLVNQLWTSTVRGALKRGHAIVVWSGYETLPYLGVVVVTPSSATAAVPFREEAAAVSSGRICGFAKNHLTLPKPNDRGDLVYRWVKAALTADHIENVREMCVPRS